MPNDASPPILLPTQPPLPIPSVAVQPVPYGDLVSWQIDVRCKSQSFSEMGTVSIEADSITAMAKMVISMTESHSPHKGPGDYSFHLESGVVHCDEVPPQAWLSNMRDLQL